MVSVSYIFFSKVSIYLFSRQDALAVIGEFSKKLTVMANDEVYKSTKEKMTLVEQEIKKSG